jgi:hypothetical protein
MRLSPLYSHRDAAIDAFRRRKMGAVFRLVASLFDQMSPIGRHLALLPLRPRPFTAAFDKSGRKQASSVTNESTEAVPVRINRRTDAAFIGQTAFCAYLLGRARGQIVDFIFGQRVLVRDRFASAFWAMRFVRADKRLIPHGNLSRILYPGMPIPECVSRNARSKKVNFYPVNDCGTN